MRGKSLARLVAVVVLVVIVAVAAIAIYSPLISWPFGAGNNEKPPGTATLPAPGPGPVIAPLPPVAEPEVIPPIESEMENKIVLTGEELQSKLGGLVERLNQSSDMKLEDLSVKLYSDRMLVSTAGLVFGMQMDIEDLDVTFDGKTILATGPVNAAGFTPTLTAKVDINTVDGKPSIEVTEFKLGAAGPLLSMLGITKEKITQMVNSNIDSRGIKLSYDVERISIEGGKLIIEYSKLP